MDAAHEAIRTLPLRDGLRRVRVKGEGRRPLWPSLLSLDGNYASDQGYQGPFGISPIA